MVITLHLHPSLHHDLTLTGSQYVESFCCSREPGKFNHSTLLIVITLKLWHATSGLYMSVFAVFLHVVQLSPPCPAGTFSLLSTTNGQLFEAVSPTDGRYWSVINNALFCYLS